VHEERRSPPRDEDGLQAIRFTDGSRLPGRLSSSPWAWSNAQISQRTSDAR
jgi:hypothetical protein